MDTLEERHRMVTGASSGLGFLHREGAGRAVILVIAGARSFKPYEGPCACGVHRIPLDVRSVESIRSFSASGARPFAQV